MLPLLQQVSPMPCQRTTGRNTPAHSTKGHGLAREGAGSWASLPLVQGHVSPLTGRDPPDPRRASTPPSAAAPRQLHRLCALHRPDTDCMARPNRNEQQHEQVTRRHAG